MDVFELIRCQIGCDYISDLPHNRRAVLEALRRMPKGAYPPEQIKALREYIFRAGFQTMGAAQTWQDDSNKMSTV